MKTIWNIVPPDNWNRARAMRRKPTAPEERLWNALKNHAIGVHIRRQHPVGVYIVDFCAIRNRLVVEVDGSLHEDSMVQEYDTARDEFLRSHGYRVLRFPAHEVMSDLDRVVETIKQHLTHSP